MYDLVDFQAMNETAWENLAGFEATLTGLHAHCPRAVTNRVNLFGGEPAGQ
ncbi:MAG: hypothetical protein GYA20_02355 [Chloroflexi bacterium]|nr:hypothetical protein [Chloroflexota bacterium]